MNDFFTELGRAVLKRWKRQNFSLETFPEIARTALEKRPPARHLDLAEFMHDFLISEDQPFQTDSEFGEPEIVTFSHPRFYIQLLFWMDGTTAIHQHEFSGAFHVMHGSSIHAHYEFQNAKSITPYLRIGDLRMKKMELLETGRTLPIVSGQRDIHSLFHLDSPSVTVVVRTQHDPGTGPQFNYLPPHVAIDPHFSDKLTLRRKQLLDVLEMTGDSDYAAIILEMIAGLDFERGFSLLHHCMGYLQQIQIWEPVIKIFEKKHGSLAAGIAATLKEDNRRNILKSLRSTITQSEHRFFLALLMNAPTRADLLGLVKKRFPKKNPTAVVLGWIEELTELSDQGVSILDASFSETLEVESENQLELFLSALSYFMNREKTLPPVMRDLSAAQIRQLRTAFEESTLGILCT